MSYKIDTLSIVVFVFGLATLITVTAQAMN